MPTFVLFAATDIRHRVESRLLAACDEWWHVPALVVAMLTVAAVAIWIYRRDAVDLRPATALLKEGRGLKDVARILKVARATLRRRLVEAGLWPVERSAA